MLTARRGVLAAIVVAGLLAGGCGTPQSAPGTPTPATTLVPGVANHAGDHVHYLQDVFYPLLRTIADGGSQGLTAEHAACATDGTGLMDAHARRDLQHLTHTHTCEIALVVAIGEHDFGPLRPQLVDTDLRATATGYTYTTGARTLAFTPSDTLTRITP